MKAYYTQIKKILMDQDKLEVEIILERNNSS